MSEPLGRDRLGRLVYANDWFVFNPDTGTVMNLSACRFYCMYRDFKTYLSTQEVNLAASPKRSNYQRYFADLGTLDEILRAFSITECTAIHCADCAFSGWGIAFGVSEYLTCGVFTDWLQQEATI